MAIASRTQAAHIWNATREIEENLHGFSKISWRLRGRIKRKYFLLPKSPHNFQCGKIYLQSDWPKTYTAGISVLNAENRAYTVQKAGFKNIFSIKL